MIEFDLLVVTTEFEQWVNQLLFLNLNLNLKSFDDLSDNSRS